MDGQADHPISSDYLVRCDIWAFGLLIGGACLRGDDYPTHLSKKASVDWSAHSFAKTNEYAQLIENMDLMRLVKRSVPDPTLGPSLFIRVRHPQVPSARPGSTCTQRWNITTVH